MKFTIAAMAVPMLYLGMRALGAGVNATNVLGRQSAAGITHEAGQTGALFGAYPEYQATIAKRGYDSRLRQLKLLAGSHIY